jgi:hypothetical protein
VNGRTDTAAATPFAPAHAMSLSRADRIDDNVICPAPPRARAQCEQCNKEESKKAMMESVLVLSTYHIEMSMGTRYPITHGEFPY